MIKKNKLQFISFLMVLVMTITFTPLSANATEDTQIYSRILHNTMKKLAETVTAPVYGTTAGEWTVLCLARGGYFEKDNPYFTDYYERIEETVNTTAKKVNLNGALHKKKSTDNSRLIVALSSIGKNATTVGEWNLIKPYDDFTWIKNQGINGVIWALIALDSNNYTTSDSTIRQQCVDYILSMQHDDGGWALTANKSYDSDPDITGMTLQALYRYRNQENVLNACKEGFLYLSTNQNSDGTYSSGGSKCSESCAQVIVACTTWGINPATDSRFIKNDISVVDALLTHYVENDAMFQHIIGAGSNAMATDQSCYALVAYDRLIKGMPSLYDYSDVYSNKQEEDSVTETTLSANITLPEAISGSAGTKFNAILSVNTWDNSAQYKMIDFMMTIPSNLKVLAITPGANLNGGTLNYHLESSTNKLRGVYFDANKNSNLTIKGEYYPAELFTISFEVKKDSTIKQYDIYVDGMSIKTTSDSSSENAMVVVNVDKACGSIATIPDVAYSAICLYTGDDVDLISSCKKAVVVSVSGIEHEVVLKYKDDKNEICFKKSKEITEKTGIPSYVALVDSNIAMENFVNKNYFTLETSTPDNLIFGDSNNDGIINAQDALSAVNCWLRKTSAPSDHQILTLNVNGDSRLNTFDALGIVEAYINHIEYGVVTKAATIGTTN